MAAALELTPTIAHMDPIFARSLVGKYFINQLQASLAGQTLLRGRVLGPIADSLSPYYLCELFPADDDTIAITTQTVIQLEQLVGVYFYEDRAIFDAAWVNIQRVLRARRAKAAKRRKQLIATRERRLIQLFEQHGVRVVKADDVQHAALSMVLEAEQAKIAGQSPVSENGDD